MKLAGLPLSPISPSRTRFSYAVKWLIAHVASCPEFEPKAEVRKSLQ